MGLPWWLGGKNPAANAGDESSIPEEGNGNPLQYSRLGNPMDKERSLPGYIQSMGF